MKQHLRLFGTHLPVKLSNKICVVVLTQISKLSMIPVVCVMEWILNNKKYSKEVKISVVVVVIGVGVCTVTDVKVNLKGFICACLAVLSTSLQQIVSVYFIFPLMFHILIRFERHCKGQLFHDIRLKSLVVWCFGFGGISGALVPLHE